MSFPNKDEQVEALLQGSYQDFALKYTEMEMQKINGCKRLVIPYEKVFDITKSEIKNYLKRKYDLDQLVPSQSREGLFLNKSNGLYQIFYQDYGRYVLYATVSTEDEVWDLYVRFLTKMSGINLNFS